MNNRLCYNLSEAAAAMGISRKFLYDHVINQPGFPLMKLGRKRLVPVDALREWLANQTEAAT